MFKNFTEFYSQIEKADYKNDYYQIDHRYNLVHIETLQYICDLSKEHQFDFRLTGAWAFVLETNKIYRTINDIDIIIPKKDFKLFLELIDKDFTYFYDEDPKSFFIKALARKSKMFRFKDKKDLEKTIDVILTDQPTDHLYKNKVIGNYNIKYRLPYKFLKREDEYFNYGRGIDSDDENFYSQYIN